MSASLSIPITVKIRVGYDKNDPKMITALTQECEQNGAQAIFVHGRTCLQGYCGTIDYKSIRMIAQTITIPVFGSGNIMNPENAHRMMQETDCAGILIARGALGNPWLGRNIHRYLQNNISAPHYELGTKITMLIKHLSYIRELKEGPPRSTMGFMRKVTLWYLTSFAKARRIRERIGSIQTYEALMELLNALKLKNDSTTNST